MAVLTLSYEKKTNTKECFSKKQQDQLVANIYPLRLARFEPELYIFPKITRDSLCIGLYYFEVTKDNLSNMVQYCLLKFEDRVAIHKKRRERYNKNQIELFKREYSDVFTPEELVKIETLFLRGTIRYYNDKDIPDNL